MVRMFTAAEFPARRENGTARDRALVAVPGGYVLESAPPNREIPLPDSPSIAEFRRGPLLDLLGFRLTVEAPGRVTVAYTVGPDHLRTAGIAHGGIIATLMDTALGFASASRAPEGLDVVTAQINVNFIRPAWMGERLEARGEVRHWGRKTAVASGEIRTESGALVATGSATLVYLPKADLARSSSAPSG